MVGETRSSKSLKKGSTTLGADFGPRSTALWGSKNELYCTRKAWCSCRGSHGSRQVEDGDVGEGARGRELLGDFLSLFSSLLFFMPLWKKSCEQLLPSFCGLAVAARAACSKNVSLSFFSLPFYFLNTCGKKSSLCLSASFYFSPSLSFSCPAAATPPMKLCDHFLKE